MFEYERSIHLEGSKKGESGSRSSQGGSGAGRVGLLDSAALPGGGDACYEEGAEHALMSKRQRMLSPSRPSTSKADQMLMISSGFDLR
jgi:hypothetical protein